MGCWWIRRKWGKILGVGGQTRRGTDLADGDNRVTVRGRNEGVTELRTQRRLPIGAEVMAPNETHFRVWAPKAKRVDLVIEESADPNAARSFPSARSRSRRLFFRQRGVGAGTLYRFRLNESEHFQPDPASRSQPGGPHRSSCVVDPKAFRWTDRNWPGMHLKGQIIYEMHVGTFTPRELGRRPPGSCPNWRGPASA